MMSEIEFSYRCSSKKPLAFKHIIYTYFLKGVVAHAFFPEFGGDAHFDNGENWTVDKYSVGVFGKLKKYLKNSINNFRV